MISVIGDTGIELSQYAKRIYPNAVRWSEVADNEVVYFSLGDMNVETFLELLIESKQIIYYNQKLTWSSQQLKSVTEHILYLVNELNIVKEIYIDNFVFQKNPLHAESIDFQKIKKEKNKVIIKRLCNFSAKNFLGLTDVRKTPAQQIWIAGCSYAQGMELNNDLNRYGELVADYFAMPVSFLAQGGTSINWAADQIIRSNIKAGDILIWGITGVHRLSWFDADSNYIFSGNLANRLKSNNKISDATEKQLIEMMLDNSRCFLAQQFILQIESFCNKIGINLIVIYHKNLSLDSHNQLIIPFLESSEHYVDLYQKVKLPMDKNLNIDLAHDNSHPGPLTHKTWADILIDYIQEKQWIIK